MLPLLAHLFGLHPWDVERLTWQQYELFCAAAEKMTSTTE